MFHKFTLVRLSLIPGKCPQLLLSPVDILPPFLSAAVTLSLLLHVERVIFPISTTETVHSTVSKFTKAEDDK